MTLGTFFHSPSHRISPSLHNGETPSSLYRDSPESEFVCCYFLASTSYVVLKSRRSRELVMMQIHVTCHGTYNRPHDGMITPTYVCMYGVHTHTYIRLSTCRQSDLAPLWFPVATRKSSMDQALWGEWATSIPTSLNHTK